MYPKKLSVSSISIASKNSSRLNAESTVQNLAIHQDLPKGQAQLRHSKRETCLTTIIMGLRLHYAVIIEIIDVAIQSAKEGNKQEPKRMYGNCLVKFLFWATIEQQSLLQLSSKIRRNFNAERYKKDNITLAMVVN